MINLQVLLKNITDAKQHEDEQLSEIVNVLESDIDHRIVSQIHRNYRITEIRISGEEYAFDYPDISNEMVREALKRLCYKYGGEGYVIELDVNDSVSPKSTPRYSVGYSLTGFVSWANLLEENNWYSDTLDGDTMPLNNKTNKSGSKFEGLYKGQPVILGGRR